MREWRKAQGWTRRQAAEYLAISPKTLEAWEYGYRKPPSLGALEKLWVDRKRMR